MSFGKMLEIGEGKGFIRAGVEVVVIHEDETATIACFDPATSRCWWQESRTDVVDARSLGIVAAAVKSLVDLLSSTKVFDSVIE